MRLPCLRFASAKTLAVRFSFLMLVLAAQSAVAATYYVSRIGGDDSRNKVKAQVRSTPWKSIQKAVDSVRGGDIVIVLNGTYYEDVRFNRGGFRGGNIRLQAENKFRARVIGSIAAYDSRFLEVDGFDVTNPSRVSNTKGISFDRCHHVSVTNCRARFCAGGGIAFDQTDWIICEDNVVHHNAFWDPSQHSGISIYQPQRRSNDTEYWGIRIRNNVCYRNRNRVNSPLFDRPTDGNGIVLDDYLNTQAPFGNGVAYDRPTIVENNLCYENGGQGIHIHLAKNCDVRNNTCVGNVLTFDFGAEITIGNSEEVSVFNNVLSALPGKRAVLQYNSSDFWVGFNLINGIVDNAPNGGGNVYGSPSFESGSLRLSAGSLGVNQGINVGGGFPTDFGGGNRIVGTIDMGAYERQ